MVNCAKIPCLTVPVTTTGPGFHLGTGCTAEPVFACVHVVDREVGPNVHADH